MNPKTPLQTLALGLVGAIVGGVAGYFLFGWIVRQGLYAPMLPAALLGWGASLCARARSMPLAIACGIAGLLLGIFTEWKFFPFIKDGSLTFFLAHLHELRPITLLMIGLGGFLGYWFSLGRDRGPA